MAISSQARHNGGTVQRLSERSSPVRAAAKRLASIYVDDDIVHPPWKHEDQM